MVTTWYGDDSPHLFLPKPAVDGGSDGCARVTGKAGETGQNSGGRQLTLDDTFGSILVAGSRAGRALLLLKRGDGSMYSQAHVRAKVMV